MKRNAAQEAELERLIAEQAGDDTEWVKQRERSLDAPLGDEGDSSLYEVVEERRVEVGPAQSKSGRVTAEQLKEWRGLRNKDHWTYARIAAYAGVSDQTVRRHIAPRTKHKRLDKAKVNLVERLAQFQAAYEAGATMREIAEVHYEELGYGTWQSCYQQLRLALKRAGVVLRPKGVKHGMRCRDAPPEVYRRYLKEHNRKVTERRRANLVRCDATVKSGRPCRRFAVLGTRFCMNHNEETKRQLKWMKPNVLEALRMWTAAHGHPPKSRDWMKATDDHPTFKTVTDLFGRWQFALFEAGLRAGYRCPSCGSPTAKKAGPGRPPKCSACKASPELQEDAA